MTKSAALTVLAFASALILTTGCSTSSGGSATSTSRNNSTSSVAGDPYDMPTPSGGAGGGTTTASSGELRDPSLNQPQNVDVSNIAATEYTVQSGDSLWKIARQYNTSVTTLKALNGMSTDTLRVGQTIKVPATR